MSMNKKQMLEMKLTNLIEARVRRVLKEESGNHNISVSRDEHYALIMLLQYAVNKRIGEKVTGLDYTSLSNLKNKINNSYE